VEVKGHGPSTSLLFIKGVEAGNEEGGGVLVQRALSVIVPGSDVCGKFVEVLIRE
jgi:hypothetical protein